MKCIGVLHGRTKDLTAAEVAWTLVLDLGVGPWWTLVSRCRKAQILRHLVKANSFQLSLPLRSAVSAVYFCHSEHSGPLVIWQGHELTDEKPLGNHSIGILSDSLLGHLT